MSEPSLRQQRRRAKLQELVCAFDGGAAALARLIGTPKSHISAVQAGRRGIGDALAAKLEDKLGKPPGWMDETQADLVLTDEERDIVLALRERRSIRLPAPDPEVAQGRAMKPSEFTKRATDALTHQTATKPRKKG